MVSAQRTRVDLFEGAWPLLMNRHCLLSSVVRRAREPRGSLSLLALSAACPPLLDGVLLLGWLPISAAPRFVGCLLLLGGLSLLACLPLLDCPPLLHEVEALPRLFDGELAGGRGGGDRSESGC